MSERSVVPHSWNVPPAIRARLGESVGRQRAIFEEGHLLLVLHAPPGPDEATRRGRLIWRSPTGEWASSDLGSGSGVLGKHLAEYASALDRFDRAEESAQSATSYFEILQGLAPLQRSLGNGYQVLADARKYVPDDRMLLNYRDQAYDLHRTAELLYGNAKHALDFTIAVRAEEESRSSRRMADAAHRLNVLVAFFFPLATLCALFGVNLRHGLENVPPPWPMLALVFVGLAAGFLMSALIVGRGRRDAGE